MGVALSTIVAPATAAGQAAIAVVRLSGPAALDIASTLTGQARFSARRATLVHIVAGGGEVLDEALLTCFPEPESVTGEDVVEISCHGSPAVVSALLERCLELGAEPARPGEFTRRAFLNGRIDLTQAEAVEDLVRSETLFQARRAHQQLRGDLSRRLQPLKEELVAIAAQLETTVEFVEDDVSPAGRAEIGDRLDAIDSELSALQQGFRTGQLIRTGARVVITGPTNAGKSTIFNSLLEFNRAITSALPGTTRDVLIESIQLGGVLAILIDTAGWRSGVDLVEQEGLARTQEEIRAADVVLLVLDGSAAELESLGRLQDKSEPIPVVVALNKSDLGSRLRLPSEVRSGAAKVVTVSALTGEGIERLRGALKAAAWPDRGEAPESGLLTRRRHKLAVDRARDHLQEARRACREGLSEEFVLYDIRKGFEALAEITGEVTPDDILDAVFSTFCIGK